MLTKFADVALSRAEMKEVSGGTNYNCWCSGLSGSFGYQASTLQQHVKMVVLAAQQCSGGSVSCRPA